MSLVTVLDDYQEVALASADWFEVQAAHTVEVITEHIGDDSALVQRLAGSEIVVPMRERTPFTADVLTVLPSLRLLVTTGMTNASIDLDAAAPRDRRVRHERLRQRDARVDDRDDDCADPQLRPRGRRGSLLAAGSTPSGQDCPARRLGWSGSAVSAFPWRSLPRRSG